MRHWMLFLCFLTSANVLIACAGWSPFGEDIRFSLLDPADFDDGGMSEFYYTSNDFGELYTHTFENDRNVDDWYAFCKGAVTKEAVFEAVYRLSAKEIINTKSEQPFVQQMIAMGKMDELEYLAFAKRYSYLNSAYYDPWERDEKDLSKKRDKAIVKAMDLIEQTNDKVLQRRYAFVALRLAFYNFDMGLVQQLYEDYFNGVEELTIDDWARYYTIRHNPTNAAQNFEVAQLFERIPSKRHGLYYMFDRTIPASDVLKYARTDQERANVLLMYAIRKQDRQLSTLQQIHRYNPNHPLLQYLIVREVNKVEDWVISPTYTYFAPVMRPGVSPYSEEQALIKQSVLEDKLYAAELLAWISVVEDQLDDELLASVSTILMFANDDKHGAYVTLKRANYSSESLKMWQQRMLTVLRVASDASLGMNDVDWHDLTDEDYAYRDRMLFLVGRIFEFNGKLGEAANFYAQVNKSDSDWSWFVWADPKGTTTYNVSFYWDYFDYFDANYSAEELANIFNYSEKQLAAGKPSAYLSQRIVNDKIRLHDLIGTKYLREDDLKHSMEFLSKVPRGYWESDTNSYTHYLAANPFYANFYSEHNKTPGDTVRYTKYEIVKELNRLVQLEKGQEGAAKAKTNWLIANCYFNMTTHGNSWLMRRSWWSTNTYNTVYVDSDEFNKCILAKAYYLKASEISPVDEFSALCLRMAGRCESYRLYFEHDYDYDFDYDAHGGYSEYMFDKNQTYKLLKQKYPQWHMELVTNCHSFNRFYHSI